jgi:hypothetical protein
MASASALRYVLFFVLRLYFSHHHCLFLYLSTQALDRQVGTGCAKLLSPPRFTVLLLERPQLIQESLTSGNISSRPYRHMLFHD